MGSISERLRLGGPGTATRARRSAAVLLASAMAIGSCGGDATGPQIELPNGSMSARVDGSQWNAALAVNALRLQGFISVTGIAADQTTITIAWPDNGTGTYSPATAIGLNASFASLVSDMHWMALGTVGTVSLTIGSVNDERVSGTFSFTAPANPETLATGTKTVTNGAFDIAF